MNTRPRLLHSQPCHIESRSENDRGLPTFCGPSRGASQLQLKDPVLAQNCDGKTKCKGQKAIENQGRACLTLRSVSKASSTRPGAQPFCASTSAAVTNPLPCNRCNTTFSLHAFAGRAFRFCKARLVIMCGTGFLMSESWRQSRREPCFTATCDVIRETSMHGFY